MSDEPVLIFGYGNASRGDDALAPLLIESLQQRSLDSVAACPVRFLSDFQMQIEHVTDLQDCACVLLVDADGHLQTPFSLYEVKPEAETGYTTHGMLPGALLHTFKMTFDAAPPPTWMLAIAGYRFELGETLSEKARANLLQAEEFCVKLLRHDYRRWGDFVRSLDKAG